MNGTTPSETAIATLQAVLVDLGWKPLPQDDASSFVVVFDPPHIPVAHAYAAIATSDELFLFFLNLGFTASEERRDPVARYLTLVNASLLLGAFVMDLDDGFLRFRCGVSFRDSALPAAMIRNCIRYAMHGVEKFSGGLIHVALRDMDPDAAFAEASRVQ